MEHAEGQKKQPKITPEQAMEVLRKNGRDVTYEQAKSILEFMRMLAGITVKHFLTNGKDSGFIYQGEHG